MEEKVEEVEAELLEELADLEHNHWRNWSRDVAFKNDLRTETIERWKKLWIPYRELSEEMKEEDRKWARKALEIIKNIHILVLYVCNKSITNFQTKNGKWQENFPVYSDNLRGKNGC